jgi:hypothetical protein
MVARKHTDEEMKKALEGRTVVEAAKLLGMGERTLRTHKARMARQGWSPEHDMTKTVPDGFHLKGTSTLYDEDGKAKLQWVKTSIDHQRQEEMMAEAIKAMAQDIVPTPALPIPAHTKQNLLNCYVITDYHLGAMCWGEETGADWNMAIAEQLLVDWFGAAIAQSPDAHTGVFAQLGDFLHWDGHQAVTPTSGHVLDADTRFQKLVRIAIGAIRRITAMLLLKHERVVLLMAEGNHDLASSMWLRELFAALYSDEPRIEVITRPDPYYCIEHGKTSLFFHHGHKKKLEALETVFVSKFREIYGRTKYSYAHTGHLHHNVMLERNTMQLEQHRTLAAPDSHASRGGWVSGRDAKVITYHKEHGDVGRIIISADMIESDKG